MTTTIIQNQSYSNLSNKDFVKLLLSFEVRIDQLTIFLRCHYPSILNELKKRTSFLDDYFMSRGKKTPILSRIYCLEHDIKQHPKCKNPNCKKLDNRVGWLRDSHMFANFCCTKCSSNDDSVREKFINTSKNKYGYENPAQSQQVKDKIKATNVKKFGCENVGQNEDIKIKIKKTNIERRGVSCPFQSQDVKDKIINTNLIKYNAKRFQQTNEFKTKVKITWSKKSKQEISSIVEHRQKTMTNLYGVNHPMKLEFVKDKIKSTVNRKYGVEYYSQTKEYHKKCHKPYTNPKYPDMTFGSSWEFNVYDFLIENSIEFEYQPSISFDYEYDGRTWTYHPDFLINGKVYEVKGDMFFRVNESTGKEEMFCPWGRKKLGEERWKWLCGKSEAKHQCMLKNGVIILRECQIKSIIQENKSFLT